MSFKYDDFKYWFLNVSPDVFNIVLKDSNEVIGKVDHNEVLVSEESEVENRLVIHDQFRMFTSRPEYAVGQPAPVNGQSFELCHDEYVNLLQGIMQIRAREAGQNPDNHQDYIKRIIDWVESTDFYNAPASTIFHEAFPHGLLYHTLTVYNNMCELRVIPKFQNTSIAGAALCTLTHDWCKIGLYESYKRNVKNEETGQWEKVDAYKRGNFPHAFGHGASSMYMVMKSFKITEEEALAIRWHMGRWNVSENEYNEYQQACEDYPLVHLIQFADQLAITNY